MRNVGLIVIIVLAVLVGVIYLGGTINIGGKKPFEYMDQALGTDFFMRCYFSLASILARHESSKEDEWTKGPQGWDKVLKNTVE